MLERILEKIEMIPFTTCWFWTGYVGSTGYPQVYYQGRTRKAHRVISHIANGTPLVGSNDSFINHRCDNPICVNPNHLYAGTRGDNERDKARAGNMRNPFGAQKLFPDDIVAIKDRLEAGHRSIDIARDYGVHKTTIGKIKAGANWSWIGGGEAVEC